MQGVRRLAVFSTHSFSCVACRCFAKRSGVLFNTYQVFSSSASQSSGGGSVVTETIAPEMVTIEILPAVEEHHIHSRRRNSNDDGIVADMDGVVIDDNANGDNNNNNNSGSNSSSNYHCHSTSTVNPNSHSAPAGGIPFPISGAYCDVTCIDPFAKSRVVNYVRRTSDEREGAAVFEVSEETLEDLHTSSQTPTSGHTGKKERAFMVVYRARCRLRLPPPHDSYVAEGLAASRRDAELLAAMHAERVCDALAVPLFRLPAMQRRHAETARRAGRYAPMPGDPVRPENTPIPPPFRMLPTQHTRHVNHNNNNNNNNNSSSGGGGGGGRAGEREASVGVFATTIAEAEIVGESHTRGNATRRLESVATSDSAVRTYTTDPSFASDNNATSSSSTNTILTTPTTTTTTTIVSDSSYSNNGGDSAATAVEGSEAPAYHTTVHYPWLSFGVYGSSGGNVGSGSTTTTPTISSTSTTTSVGVVSFDPTEGGMWEMVNTASTRCSPSPDALLLPCVYEATAYERIKDHFLQQGIALKDRMAVSHVAVAGHSARMYVVEIRLHDALVARGKAQTRECAEHLAAMHAELLLDALARPLFPSNAERQAKHAVAVERFGRWAPNPLTQETQHPRPHDPLPLPLKQQVGGDEVWLDPQMLRRCNNYNYQRSSSERIIAAHNEVNNYCGDYIEANPDPQLLLEARQALVVWQREFARNPHPELFVITRMGEQFRASTLLPVPRVFGVRGGNAVGKTMEQAMDLCALHAVDTLCALGIPLYADPKRQEQFIQQRRQIGLVTHDVMMDVEWGKGLVAILAPSLKAGSVNHVNNSTSSASSSAAAAVGAHMGGEAKQRRPPYLPGYIVEGNQPRPLPHIRDTARILQLRIPDDFTVYGEDLSDETLVENGNEAKVCVQNYLRYHLPKNVNVNASVYITGYGRQVSVHNIAYLPLVLPKKSRHIPMDALSGKGKKKKKTKDTTAGTQQKSAETKESDVVSSTGVDETPVMTASLSSQNTTTMEEGGEDVGRETERLLAVGISLKKKDAERVCYLHAVDILRMFDQDVLTNYRAGLPRRKPQEQPTTPASSTSALPAPPNTTGSVSTINNANQPSEEEQPEMKSNASTNLPKPYMHKLMKNFMESGRHYTSPKKRPSPSPYSPF